MYERKYTYTPQTAIARIGAWKVKVTASDPGLVRADSLFIYSTFLLRSLSGSNGWWGVLSQVSLYKDNDPHESPLHDIITPQGPHFPTHHVGMRYQHKMYRDTNLQTTVTRTIYLHIQLLGGQAMAFVACHG